MGMTQSEKGLRFQELHRRPERPLYELRLASERISSAVQKFLA